MAFSLAIGYHRFDRRLPNHEWDFPLLDEEWSRDWKAILARPVGEQVNLSDDLMQMTTSPLGGGDPSDWTMSELLHHACPPIPWLQGVSRFARSGIRDGSLERDLATALYHAVLAAALVRRKQYLTRSSDAVLREGMEACLAFSWLDRETRRLLEQARAMLGPPGNEGDD